MRGRLAVLMLAAVGCAFGQANFVWDHNGSGPYGPYTWGWILNGDTTFAASTGGSVIWPMTVTGTNPNDYEVNTTIYANSPGGTYMHFLRASSTNVAPGSGNYISVELAVPANWQSGTGVPLASGKA